MEFTPGDNFLYSVNGKKVKCPTKFNPRVSDISGENAGRTLDGTMHKDKQGQKYSVDLMWDVLNTAELSEILKIFDDEYLTVVYLHVKEGKFITDEFYIGDRAVQAYNSALDIWENLEFTLIQR